MTQTIGQRLKAEREEQRLTIEKVFEATRIRTPYLQALEADDLSKMPSPVQARGYLRNYVEFLGLNYDQLLNEMRSEQKAADGIDVIIGPADDAATLQHSSPPPADSAPVVQPAPQAPEPILIEEVESPVVDAAPLSKPVTGRRKKADSQVTPDPAQPLKRRGRKKVEPQPEPLPIVEPEPEIIAESLASIEPIPEPPEAVIEESVETQLADTPPPDISDNLWQTWLNRLNTVISARAKRPTLVVNESASTETHLDSIAIEAEMDSQADDAQGQGEIQGLLVEKSSEIFREIGIELRQRRELLSLHLDEVERNTHVKAHYLAALEKGAMDDLPSTVQTRGMLSNYATFLDLDHDVLLLRYADALQARHRERNPQKPARKSGQPIIENIPSMRSFIAGDMIFGIGIAILLVGFSIWGVSRVLTIQSQRDVQPSAPSISDVLLASPDPSQFTATPVILSAQIPGEATVTVVIPTQDVDVSVQVNLIAVERTYLRVTVDGEELFNGRVVPGTAYPFQAQTQIEVLVGSGAAIRTVYNGRDLGLMGTFGQVVNNIYLSEEVITPTALSSPTITVTIVPTSTVPATPTVPATSTPVPSITPTP
ncbi:MAG: RodZ domain-containing protein [Anaerolineales bacterium]